MLKFRLQSLTKALLLLVIGTHIIWRILGQLSPTSEVLTDCHCSLLQVQEFSTLQFDFSLRHKVMTESSLKLIPIDILRMSVGCDISSPPIRCWAIQLVGSK